MRRCKGERVPVCLLNECRIVELIAEFPWKDLGPDCARDSIAQCASDVVTGKKETGYHGKICYILVKSVKKENAMHLRSCLVAAWILAWAEYGNRPPAANNLAPRFP